MGLGLFGGIVEQNGQGVNPHRTHSQRRPRRGSRPRSSSPLPICGRSARSSLRTVPSSGRARGQRSLPCLTYSRSALRSGCRGSSFGLFVDVVSLQGQGWVDGGSVCHPLDCPSAVSEDRHLAVGLLTSGEIVAEGGIVGCLPIYNQSDGHIVEVAIKLLSEVCLGFVPSNEPLITSFDVIDAVFRCEGINSIVSDQFTTTNVLFVVINEHTLVVVIDELQNVIQSVVVIQQLFDFLNSASGEHFFVVSGQGHGHGLLFG